MPKRKKETAIVASTSRAVAQMPEWVPDVEDTGTAMMQAAQEMMLAVDDVLIRFFDFDDDKIKKFHESLKPILQQVEEYERHGLSIMTPNDMAVVGEIAKTRFMKERFVRMGLEVPILPGAAPFLKALAKKNERK